MLWIDLAIVLAAIAIGVAVLVTVWGTARRFSRELKGLTVPRPDPRRSRSGPAGAP